MRKGSPWMVVAGLAALLLLGLVGRTLFQGEGSGGRTPPAPPGPPDMTLPEVLAGVLLLELEPTLAVTPQQARILQEQLSLARQAVDPKTRDSANLAGLLVVYFLENLRPEQIEAMRTQRSLLEVYLPKSAEGGTPSGLVDDLDALLTRRAGGDTSQAPPSVPGSKGSPAPSSTAVSSSPQPPPAAGETRLRDLTRGLLKLAAARPLKDGQAATLLAVLPDLRLALKALPPEAGGVDPRTVAERVRAALDAEQWEQVRAGQPGVRTTEGKRASDEEVVEEVERLLQARVQGRPARSRFLLGEAGPAAARPSPVPRRPAPGGQPPPPARQAPPPGAQPPPPGQAQPGSAGDAFPDLIFQRLLPAVENLPAGDPRLALSSPQKAKIREILPQLEQAVAAMATEPRSEPVARAEYRLKQVLTREQLAWLAEHSTLVRTGELKTHLATLRKVVGAPSGDAR